jgi:DNA-binding SARP family transcriptional activator/Tfp pilus assembly protein PilF
MRADAEFGVLGPLLVRRDGVAVAVPPGKQRVLLAALLLSANQAVSLDELAETLWGSCPPTSARVTLQNYVKRLRKALESNGDARISTMPRGYLIRVKAGEFDVSRFEASVGRASDAARAGAWDRAAAELRAALSLWRGEPLADVPSELLTQREVPRLAEMRLQAVEARIEADLHLGRHADVIAELRRLTGVHPLRERLHALLMLALYRAGQQAEALAAYQRARRVLIRELGAEPGPELRRLERQVLTGDPELQASQAAESREALHISGPGPGQLAWTVVPRQLPAPVRHFAGRAAELDALTALPDPAGQAAPGTVVIAAITGTAGVGKTALAVRWAHQVANRFSDGQLYVNLRGYDPGQPMPAAEALAGFLRALGLPGPQIPVEQAERAAVYRSLLAGRRVLIVLDNAREPGQVRPLLPGTPGCMVVVTSRDTLAGLVARDGAQRLELDALPLADAVALLRDLIGPRVDAEPDAAAQLAGLCCRLPLTLRVAAELAASRPRQPLAALADELGGQRRLDWLDADKDQATAVRAVFSWSCRHLSPDAARLFRLAALHPGTDFDSRAAAALTGATHEHACRALAELARGCLLWRDDRDRYGMHDLLRAYGAELPAAHDRETERREAFTRLLDHYLTTAASAARILFPADPGLPPASLRDAAVAVTDEPTARAWLEAERANLTAAAVHASEQGWPEHAIGLSASVFGYLGWGGFYDQALVIREAAVRAAARAGDRAAEARARVSLGAIQLLLCRYQLAEQHCQRGLTLSRQISDQHGELRALLNLGNIYRRMGDYDKATECNQEALELSRATGDQARESRALENLGRTATSQGRYRHAAGLLRQAAEVSRQAGDPECLIFALVDLGEVEVRRGRYREARSHLRQARTVARQNGHAIGEANATCDLGVADLREGRLERAARHLQQALSAFHDAGARTGEAEVLCHLGEADLRLGQLTSAATRFEQARALYRQISEPAGEADARNGLGEVALAARALSEASAHHQAALAIAIKVADLYQQARAHEGLGDVCAAACDAAGARRHWQRAFALHAEMDTPAAVRIRGKLTGTESPQTPAAC